MNPAAKSIAGSIARGVLFLYVVMLLAPFNYVPDYPSVDNTWAFALNWGAAHGLAVGRDLIWTTGPLGYLSIPMDIGNNLANGFVFQWAQWIVLALVFGDVFFLCGFALRNLAAFTFFFGLSAPLYAPGSGSENRIVAAALVMLVAARWKGGRHRYIAALVLTGLAPLIKLTGGILLGGAILGYVADSLWRQRSKAWPDVALAATVPAAVAVITCRLTMPSFSSILLYVKGSQEIADGFNSAMGVVGDLIELGGAAEMLLWIGALLYFASKAEPALRRFFLLMLPLPLFLSFKHSFVRQDVHIVTFFVFSGLVLALISLAMSIEGQRVGMLLIMMIPYTITWVEYAPARLGGFAFDMVDGVVERDRLHGALHPAELRAQLRASAEHSFPPETRLEPELRAMIGDATVGEMALTYASAKVDGLNLKLFPVVQRYGAFTAYLDELNARWLREQGPRFLVADWEAIDGRHPIAETPAMWREAYRWYDTRKLGARHLLLERRAAARFTEVTAVRNFDMPAGSAIDLPESDAPEFWSVSCGYRLIGSLRKFLLRIAPVMMRVDGGKPSRVVMEVLSSPVMGNVLPANLSELAALFEASGSFKPGVRRISLRGPGIVNYGPVCHAEIYSLR